MRGMGNERVKSKDRWVNVMIIGIAMSPLIAVAVAAFIFLHFLVKFWVTP